MQQDCELLQYRKNIKNYETINYWNAAILIWGVMTLYYNWRGLSFFEISVIQSIGAVVTIALEIPSGWLSDRYGHAFALRISALCNVIAVVLLIISNHFFLFLAAEIFSATASAAQSGADTALFYNSLTKLGRQEEYAAIRAKIRGRQSLIRVASRFIAPLIFSIFGTLPFIFSAGIYLIIACLTLRYKNFDCNSGETEKVADQTEAAETRRGILRILVKYKRFILYSILSAFVLVSVSNYSQYVSPFLVERGLDIKWLSVVLAAASVGDYLGTKLIRVLRGVKNNDLIFLLAILICGFVIWGGFSDTVIGGAAGYFGISMMHSPFTILLGDSLNKAIDNRYRATLLSVSNQFDEVFGIAMDPIIGAAIDAAGFRMVYICMGAISALLLLAAGVFLRKTGSIA